jgi:hypothetical protein
VAESEFGEYKEETSATLTATSESISSLFNRTESITTDAAETTIRGSNAWCKIGVVGTDDDGDPVYGMEIGQTDSVNGTQVSKKFAQYRTDGVHLYDQNGTEVATISNSTLSITNAMVNSLVVSAEVRLGGYIISTTNGLAFKWGGS